MSTAAKNKLITPDLIDAQLNQGGFRAKAPIRELSDPIADTAMVVTLDQLRAYENNPRTTRNPAFDEIKESIRSRGLDQPPPITKRPGESFYIIRNGGNTRLQILQELWKETRDERFYRIHCLFKPWQSEASVLVGHLAENEVRGNLSFIEKAVGIKRLKDMYEANGEGKSLSLRNLSERLKGDGLPVSKTLLGGMLDCVEALLPAIPEILYRGLGKHQVEKLLSLRSGLQEVYKSHGNGNKESFMDFWVPALAGFDLKPEDFRFTRVEDELIGQLSKLIGRDYRMIQLDLASLNPEQEATEETAEPLRPTAKTTTTVSPVVQPSTETKQPEGGKAKREPNSLTLLNEGSNEPPQVPQQEEPEPITLSEEERQQRIAAHTISPVTTTPRVKEILRKAALVDGEVLPDFEDCAVRAIPVQAGGKLVNVTDVWYIEGRFDSPIELRRQIYLLAAEIALWGGNFKYVVPTETAGLGFELNNNQPLPQTGEGATAAYLLFSILRISKTMSDEEKITLDSSLFSQILIGGYEIQIGPYKPEDIGLIRLPDDALVRFFRLIRLARRLVDLNKRGES
ncbi:MAG: ParB N-terminal domain-containing protein [Betaproteobacteria bacterium]|nr:ParB N-terminal domain-containing protein [Betaproteobacteria bacterium]